MSKSLAVRRASAGAAPPPGPSDTWVRKGKRVRVFDILLEGEDLIGPSGECVPFRKSFMGIPVGGSLALVSKVPGSNMAELVHEIYSVWVKREGDEWWVCVMPRPPVPRFELDPEVPARPRPTNYYYLPIELAPVRGLTLCENGRIFTSSGAAIPAGPVDFTCPSTGLRIHRIAGERKVTVVEYGEGAPPLVLYYTGRSILGMLTGTPWGRWIWISYRYTPDRAATLADWFSFRAWADWSRRFDSTLTKAVLAWACLPLAVAVTPWFLLALFFLAIGYSPEWLPAWALPTDAMKVFDPAPGDGSPRGDF